MIQLFNYYLSEIFKDRRSYSLMDSLMDSLRTVCNPIICFVNPHSATTIHASSTGSRPISEVNLVLASLVLG